MCTTGCLKGRKWLRGEETREWTQHSEKEQQNQETSVRVVHGDGVWSNCSEEILFKFIAEEEEGMNIQERQDMECHCIHFWHQQIECA